MPNLAAMSLQPQPHKVIVVAPSGTGKTALIGSLANAGYRCFVWDYDNGTDILFDPKVCRPDSRHNIFIRKLTDQLHESTPIMPRAAADGLKAMDDWQEDGKSLGNLSSWGPRDVAVIDTLGFFGDACLRYILFMNGRLGKQPQIQDYGSAMDILEKALEKLYSDHTHCNVLVLAHQIPVNDSSQMAMKMVPLALGSKLPPKVPRYFNNMISIEKRIIGKEVTRVLLTNATALLDLKTTAPSTIPNEMVADLAAFFKLLDQSRSTAARS